MRTANVWKCWTLGVWITALTAMPAMAQPRVELSGVAGWTISDGVDGDPVLAGDGNIYDEIGPKDSGSWGASLGVNVTDRVEVGFLFSQQRSTAEIRGTATRDIGDLTIDTYHPYVAYNFTPADAPVRPYVLFGAGATRYGGVSFVDAAGVTRETSGETQFSGTVGAGLKVFAGGVGFRAGMQWTPTYIKTDEVGWWCDPFWGCYLVGEAQYANQFQFAGGVTFRF